MIDSDNVGLLRPVTPEDRFPAEAAKTTPTDGGIISASIYYLKYVDAGQFVSFFDRSVMPWLTEAGIHPIARLVAEESPNTYPRLPIRERDRAFVWFARWTSIAAEEAFLSKFRELSGWRDSAPDAVLPALMEKPERRRLAATTRSSLR